MRGRTRDALQRPAAAVDPRGRHQGSKRRERADRLGTVNEDGTRSKEPRNSDGVTEFQSARMMMKCVFNADRESGGVYDAYQSNVAMLLSDRYGIDDHGKRNEAAAAILDLIFDLQDTPPAA